MKQYTLTVDEKQLELIRAGCECLARLNARQFDIVFEIFKNEYQSGKKIEACPDERQEIQKAIEKIIPVRLGNGCLVKTDSDLIAWDIHKAIAHQQNLEWEHRDKHYTVHHHPHSASGSSKLIAIEAVND